MILVDTDYTASVQRKGAAAAAVEFLQLVVAGKIHQAYDSLVDPNMKHHNPFFAGDAASLRNAMDENHSQFPAKLLDVLHVFESGDLVAVHSQIRLNQDGPSIAAVHIFRFEGPRIIELWDIAQPEPANSPNQNGMF